VSAGRSDGAGVTEAVGDGVGERVLVALKETVDDGDVVGDDEIDGEIVGDGVGESVLVALNETVDDGDAVGDDEIDGEIVDESVWLEVAVGDSVGVGEVVGAVTGLFDLLLLGVAERVCVCEGDGVHESGAARPLARQLPHVHGVGADEASGQ